MISRFKRYLAVLPVCHAYHIYDLMVASIMINVEKIFNDLDLDPSFEHIHTL